MSEPRKFKRCRRYDEPGHAHVLTFSCFRGLPLLGRDRTRAWLIRSIGQARAACRFDVWAWVVMPEHVHLMIHPREAEYSISNILRPIPTGAIRQNYLAEVVSSSPELAGTGAATPRAATRSSRSSNAH